MFSSTFPSFLLPALPCAFLSQSDHFVASMALRNMAPPTEVLLTKHYYKPHIEDIKRQFQHARELGSASAEEWIKGLENEGKERSNDAARWEQWEAKGGLKKVNSRPNTRTTGLSVKHLPRMNIPVTRTSQSPNGTTPQVSAPSGTQTSNDANFVEAPPWPQNIPGKPILIGLFSYHMQYLTDNICSSTTCITFDDNSILRWFTSAAPRYVPTGTARAEHS